MLENTKKCVIAKHTEHQKEVFLTMAIKNDNTVREMSKEMIMISYWITRRSQVKFNMDYHYVAKTYGEAIALIPGITDAYGTNYTSPFFDERLDLYPKNKNKIGEIK